MNKVMADKKAIMIFTLPCLIFFGLIAFYPRAVCDWLSGMTDQYSMKKFKEIFIPRAWEVY